MTGFVGAAPIGSGSFARTTSTCSQSVSARAASTTMVYGTPRPVQIIPSVLPADWANMGADCKRLEDAGVDRIQFDVMDGNFVPNLTFGPELISACRKYTKVPFETQLMVSNYNSDEMLDQYVEATKGPNGEPGVVIVHVEACTHLHRSLARIRALGGSPSVALNPHTPAEMVENVLDMVDHVLVMTVNPGFGGTWVHGPISFRERARRAHARTRISLRSHARHKAHPITYRSLFASTYFFFYLRTSTGPGQAYIPTMTSKIEKLRKWIVDRGLDVDIEVDGGVKADWTIAACAAAGANCFIAGSGMFAYVSLMTASIWCHARNVRDMVVSAVR